MDQKDSILYTFGGSGKTSRAGVKVLGSWLRGLGLQVLRFRVQEFRVKGLGFRV